jgi:hypothetical protein
MGQEEKVLARDRPGRPKAGEQPALRTVYRLRCAAGEPSTQQLDDGRKRENAFVLLTNVAAEDVPTPEVLREYKFQTSVETRFKFLKSPTYMDAVYVHRKDRLEALMYVVVIAALIFTLLERRVRNALANRGEKLVLPGNRQVNRPTATSLLNMLSKVIVLGMSQRLWTFTVGGARKGRVGDESDRPGIRSWARAGGMACGGAGAAGAGRDGPAAWDVSGGVAGGSWADPGGIGGAPAGSRR